jgi:hypothetical protein
MYRHLYAAVVCLEQAPSDNCTVLNRDFLCCSIFPTGFQQLLAAFKEPPATVWKQGRKYVHQLSEGVLSRMPALRPVCATPMLPLDSSTVSFALDEVLLDFIFDGEVERLPLFPGPYLHSVLQHYVSSSRLPAAAECFLLLDSFR